MAFINYNGGLIEESKFKLSYSNRGFLYGDSFFETIRLIDGKPIFLSDHYLRMQKGFELLGLDQPAQLTYDEFQKQIHQLAELNGVTAGGRVRLSLFRASEGKYIPAEDKCCYIIECNPLEDNFYSFKTKGLHIGIYEEQLKPVHPLLQIKTNNSLIYVLAGVFARKNKLDDVILTNEWENLAEATSSNLFTVKGNTIYSPGLDDGCVDGVLRKNLIKLINESDEFEFEYSNITEEDLHDADEIFITNVVSGIQWIVALETKRFYTKHGKRLAEMLNHHIQMMLNRPVSNDDED